MSTSLRLQEFWLKINATNMNTKERIKAYNQKICAKPTYVSHSEILQFYPKLNWRKIKKWAVEEKLI